MEKNTQQLGTNTIILLCIGGIFLVVLGGVAGYLLFGTTHTGDKNPQTSTITSNTNENTSNQNSNNSISNVNVSSEQTNEQSDGNQVPNAKTPISWTTPKKIPSLKITTFETNEKQYTEAEYTQVATLNEGKYAGYDLILARLSGGGMGTTSGYFRFAKKGSTLVFFPKYSDEVTNEEEFHKNKYIVDTTYVIAALDYPETLQGPTSKQELELVDVASEPFSLQDLKKVFTDPKLGSVYTSVHKKDEERSYFTGNAFYVATPDGLTKTYTVKLSFMGTDNTPAITWQDGSRNSLEYISTDINGCGSVNYASVMSADKVNRKVDLEEAGMTITGDPVYVFRNANHPFLKNIYENEYTVYEGQKMSYKAFVANHPIFFWVDPFDRLIKFQGNKFLPAVECGKPVIYLYPEKNTRVSVKLSPRGGFSKTEPAYNTGWVVDADPESSLREVSSGNIYPYLFWEGRGGLYTQPKKGFMIKKEEVHTFLLEKLSVLGLNSKETRDFMEFWEPRMQEKPYYFVTFLGNKEMNELAPLDVTPKPDTVIRVLMDYTALDLPYCVEELKIKTPTRNGFTLLEWGGVLR